MSKCTLVLSIGLAFVATTAATQRRAAAQSASISVPGGITPGGDTPAFPELPPLPNWGFEDGLRDWTATGTAFARQPTWAGDLPAWRIGVVPLGGDYWTDLPYPLGVRGNRWIGTFERRPTSSSPIETQGDGPQGDLTSKRFQFGAEDRYLSFLIGGGRDTTRLTVQLLQVRRQLVLTPCPGKPGCSTGGIVEDLVPAPGIAAVTGHNSEVFRRAWWNVSALDRSKQYVIRIRDASSGVWGHINVDDFRFLPQAPSSLPPGSSGSVIRAQFRDSVTRVDFLDWADAAVPLWGSADMHTHPMSHLGMGKKLMHGAPDATPSGGSIVPAGTHGCNPTDFRATTVDQALGDCNSTHGGWGTDNTCGNYIRAAVLNKGFDKDFVHQTSNPHGDHEHAGFPAFRFWPHYTSKTHQQMYVDWIRRAYEGGLRVMVALAVNSEIMAEVLDGDEPKDDKRSADLQIDEIGRFVARHSDFMQVVRTASEMRTAVRQNKLAVVLGVEVDNFGNFNDATVPRDEAAVLAEIRRLHGKGVRYMFPIHLTDNVLGGTAIYDPFFNFANRYARSRPLPHGLPIPPGYLFRIEHATDRRITARLGLFDGPPGAVGAALAGVWGAWGLIGGIPFPPAVEEDPACLFNMTVSCTEQYRVVQSLLSPTPEWDAYTLVRGGHQNELGLTDIGVSAIHEMMRLGMLIDIDHMSDHAANDTLDIAERYWYPINSGHNGVRGDDDNERTRSPEQLAILRDLGGMFGVGCAENHAGGFLQSYRTALPHLGNRSVTLGSDVNGFESMPQPRHIGLPQSRHGIPEEVWNRRVAYEGVGALTPQRFGDRVWDYNVDGVAHIGLFPDFYQDLKNLGMSAAERRTFFSAAEDFAWMWETAELQAAVVP